MYIILHITILNMYVENYNLYINLIVILSNVTSFYNIILILKIIFNNNKILIYYSSSLVRFLQILYTPPIHTTPIKDI